MIFGRLMVAGIICVTRESVAVFIFYAWLEVIGQTPLACCTFFLLFFFMCAVNNLVQQQIGVI